MYFKDWDSQRAAKSELSKDGREEVKKENYTGREGLVSSNPEIKLWKPERKGESQRAWI